MDYKLVVFWNMFYSLMIVTAVLGNCAVLWIVIRKFKLIDMWMDNRGQLSQLQNIK